MKVNATDLIKILVDKIEMLIRENEQLIAKIRLLKEADK